MTEQKKVGHAQHLKAVNNPIRKEMLKRVNAVNQILEVDLLNGLKKDDILNDENTFQYHASFLTQALCMEKVETEGEVYYKILPGGKVVENF
ncbi:MAG: hypothetical protein JW891_10815 [Candidatus Lokiarchaeota archaeon]|nr:hypothetical protein [Candidatus Lokiarchaeota archaeon]